MNLSALFIKRPVTTTLIMLGILVFGLMAYRLLPVSDLPVIDFPTIQVQANLPGELGNLAVRADVKTGDNVLISGLILGGSTPKRVLLRAIGPSLTAVGVPDALQDPLLELHDSSGATIASNDNWRSSQETQISQSGLAPADDRDLERRRRHERLRVEFEGEQ